MSDVDLIVFGCVVSFIAAAGAYVFLRERYENPKDRPGGATVQPEQRPEGRLSDVA